MTGSSTPFLVCLGGLLLSACGHDFEPPDRSSRVQRATAQYTPALFDTIQWDREDDRILRGNLVYAERCARCHGPLGRGDTAYSRGRGLTVPSLVEADWRLTDLDGVRRAIYSGHERGMPIFGETILGPRAIDAAAAYILFTLRPEVGADRGAPSEPIG